MHFIAESRESPLNAEVPIREGQVLTGPLFSEPMQVERPCCMDHPEGCLIIVFFNTGDNLDAT